MQVLQEGKFGKIVKKDRSSSSWYSKMEKQGLIKMQINNRKGKAILRYFYQQFGVQSIDCTVYCLVYSLLVYSLSLQEKHNALSFSLKICSESRHACLL